MAIVVHHHHMPDTLECLHSLRSSDYPHLSIFVIDNSNQTNYAPLPMLRSLVDHYRATPNRGFAAACNIALRYAMANHIEYVWLINPDLIVESGTLLVLLNTIQINALAVCCGPKLVYYNDQQTIQFAGGYVRCDEAYWFPRGDWELDAGQYNRVEEVDWLSGGCILLRTEAVREIGFMDESYFLYYEDVDWCIRARKRGWKCIYVGTTTVRHMGSRSTSQVRSFYYPRAHFLFLAKHYPHFLIPALRRYYNHYLHPHIQQRKWQAAWGDMRVYLSFLSQLVCGMPQKVRRD